MTEHHDPLDELASAHLDGQTTPDEVARITADPELAARVLRMATVRDAVRMTSEPIDEARRDADIGAALDAFDEAAIPVSGEAPAAGVVALVPHAARQRARRTVQLVGIAAALILVALLVPFLDRLDSGSNDQAAGGPEVNSAVSDAAASGAEDSAAATARSATPSAGPDDLGPFGALPDLAAAVREQMGGSTSTMESGPAVAGGTDEPATTPCRDTEQASEGGPVLYSALATLDGQAVVVIVREEPEGARTLLILDRADCRTVASGRL